MQFLSRLKLYNTNVSSIISIKPSSCYHFHEITNLFHDALSSGKDERNNMKIETLFSCYALETTVRAVVCSQSFSETALRYFTWFMKRKIGLRHTVERGCMKKLFHFSIFPSSLTLSHWKKKKISRSSVSNESLDVSVQWKFSSRGEKEK